MQQLKTYPYFSGQKILYVHGFASSGRSGTVGLLRRLLPETTVVAPDLPVEPLSVLPLLREVCLREAPALVIGTSMGGMFTEQLHGFDRILVNPAFEIAETIRSNNWLGRHEFHNPREDGAKDFLVTKSTIEDFRTVTSQSFSHAAADADRVVGLFGTRDELVHTFPLFAAHYPHAVHFDGEHRLNESVVHHSLMPVIRRFSDRSEGRQRPVLYVSLDTLRKPDGTPVSEAPFAFERLGETYDVYVVAPAPWNNASAWGDARDWAERNLGVGAYNRVLVTPQPAQLYGDYFVSRDTMPDFLGTAFRFGDDPFRTWENVLTYFDRLNGQ